MMHFLNVKNEKYIMKYTQLLFINGHSLYNSFISGRKFSMTIMFTQLLIQIFGVIKKNIKQQLIIKCFLIFLISFKENLNNSKLCIKVCFIMYCITQIPWKVFELHSKKLQYHFLLQQKVLQKRTVIIHHFRNFSLISKNP